MKSQRIFILLTCFTFKYAWCMALSNESVSTEELNLMNYSLSQNISFTKSLNQVNEVLNATSDQNNKTIELFPIQNLSKSEQKFKKKSYFNQTIHTEDEHDYYSYQVLVDPIIFDNQLRVYNELFSGKHSTHPLLSDEHQVAVQMELSFTFPFYGNPLKKITVATGGFIYMSDFLHRYLTYTQYIAPLMADFNTSIGSNTSQVKIADIGDAFTVVWDQVRLQKFSSVGPFNFQAILFENGTIVFIYHKIPLSTTLHGSLFEVGLSDAYYHDDNVLSKREIIEYHRVEIDKSFVHDDIIIILIPFATCVEQKSCWSCLNSVPNFNCSWCENLQRCSSGLDRLKQDWQEKHCHLTLYNIECPANIFKSTSMMIVIIWVFIFMVLFIGGLSWIYYSYQYPTSSSGLWLMEHRPSALRQRLSRLQFFKKMEDAETKYMATENTDETVA